MPKPPVARLTTPAEMVAAMPLHLGYVPTESIVVACLSEPRGRMGLTMRFDLPAPQHERLLVQEIARRVRHQNATRVLLGIYTDEPDGDLLARTELFDLLAEEFHDLRVAEAFLVRDDRFWTYTCGNPKCCPAGGTPVAAGSTSSAVRLIAAEAAFEGRAVLRDRAALEASLAGPTFLQARAAMQRLESASVQLTAEIESGGLPLSRSRSHARWNRAVRDFADPPGLLGHDEAAALVVSLVDVVFRDEIAASPAAMVPAVLAVLAELMRRTPAPYDAPVCALFGWMTYCEGGGAEVTIALERSLFSDPDYALARLLDQALSTQLPPAQLRTLTLAAQQLERKAG